MARKCNRETIMKSCLFNSAFVNIKYVYSNYYKEILETAFSEGVGV